MIELLINAQDVSNRMPGQVVVALPIPHPAWGRDERPPLFVRVVVEDARLTDVAHLLVASETYHPQTEAEAFLGLRFAATRMRRRRRLATLPKDGAKVKLADLSTVEDARTVALDKPDVGLLVRQRLAGMALERGYPLSALAGKTVSELLRMARGY